MSKFIFWYKKELEAPDVLTAVRKEKKIPVKFHSLEEKEDKKDQLEPLIGFQIPTESDYEDEDDDI